MNIKKTGRNRLSNFIWPILFSILSCNAEKDTRTDYYDKNNLLIKGKFFPDSTISSEISYANDTLRHGWTRYYYPNSRLKLEINYDSGVKQGMTSAFFENGKIEYHGKYANGKEDSTFVWYSDNGKLSGVYNWFNGKPLGDQIEYFKDGKLDVYFFNNLEGNTIFRIRYDTINNQIFSEGDPLYMVYNKNHLLKGCHLEIICILAAPPESDCNLILYKIDANTKILKRFQADKNSFIKEYYGLKFIYKEHLDSAGVITYKIKYLLNIPRYKYSQNDSTTLVLKVVEN